MIAVHKTNEEEYMLVTKKGNAIRIKTSDIRPIGKTATGVKAIKLNDDDKVVSAFPIYDDSKYVGFFTKSGQGKLVDINEFNVQGRGGKGLLCAKNSEIVSSIILNKDDEILVNGISNTIRLSVNDLPVVSRTALGNNLIKNSKIISVSKI